MKASIIALTIIIIMTLCGCSTDMTSSSKSKDDDSVSDNDGYKSQMSEVLRQLCYDNIEVEVGETEEVDGKAAAKVTVYVPDYTSLFLAASQAEDFNRTLEMAIIKGGYETIEYSEYVEVTVVEGETVVAYSDTVKALCEKELIKAINAMTEGG